MITKLIYNCKLGWIPCASSVVAFEYAAIVTKEITPATQQHEKPYHFFEYALSKPAKHTSHAALTTCEQSDCHTRVCCQSFRMSPRDCTYW